MMKVLLHASGKRQLSIQAKGSRCLSPDKLVPFFEYQKR